MSDAGQETRAKLLQTAVEMLDDLPEKDVTASEILRRTGIARGSLYHFWSNIGELLEEAYIVRYSRNVAEGSKAIKNLLDKSNTKEEFFEGLAQITAVTQNPKRKSNRYERARILGMAEKNHSFRKALGQVQQELTDTLTEQVMSAQSRGWVTRELDPRTIAVLIQAYTLGKVVDDVVENQMNPDHWNQLIGLIVDKALVGEK